MKRIKNTYIVVVILLLASLTSCSSRQGTPVKWELDNIEHAIYLNGYVYVITNNLKFQKINAINSQVEWEEEFDINTYVAKIGVHPESNNVYIIKDNGQNTEVIVIQGKNKIIKCTHLEYNENVLPIFNVPDYVFGGSHVYVTSPNNGNIYCIDDSNGNLVWNTTIGELDADRVNTVIPVSAITLSPEKNVLFAVSSLGKSSPIYCIDAATGDILWKYKHSEYNNIEYMSVVGEYLVVPADNIDVSNSWFHSEEPNDRSKISSMEGGALVILNFEGEELQTIPIKTSIELRTFKYDDASRIFFVQGSTMPMDEEIGYNILALYALSTEGDILWSTSTMEQEYHDITPTYDNMIIKDDIIYYGTLDGNIVGIDLEGNPKYKIDGLKLFSKKPQDTKSIRFIGSKDNYVLLKQGSRLLYYPLFENMEIN